MDPRRPPEPVGELGALRRWTDAPWITWGECLGRVGPARWYAAHVAGEPALRSDSLAVQIAAVKAGIGVALMPAPSIAHYVLVPIKLSAKLRGDVADGRSVSRDASRAARRASRSRRVARARR